MLKSLNIKNYVLIDCLSIDFNQGLTSITGETGSGKSIILGSLALILGEKAKSDVVRLGEKEAVLEAVFSYAESSEIHNFLSKEDLLDQEGEVCVKRVIRANGKSIVYINDYTVNLATLVALAPLLVEVSSQHAHQSLLKSDTQRLLLDKAAKNDDILSSYKKAYSELTAAVAVYEKTKSDNESAKREIDYLTFCLKELTDAKLVKDEDEEIKKELDLISSKHNIKENIDYILDMLSGSGEGVFAQLNKTEQYLKKAIKYDDTLEEYLNRIVSLNIDLDDIAASLSNHIKSIDSSAEYLDRKSARLSELQGIKKKYGPSLDLCIEKRDNYTKLIENIDKGEEYLEELKLDIDKKQAVLDTQSEKLTASRKKAALILSKEVTDTLSSLSMKNAIFEIEILDCSPSSNGANTITYYITANKGAKKGEIKSIASGGELSRIILALKSVLSTNVNTLIFDEVDAGLGGSTANSIAQKLKDLAKTAQVITITHLASIASVADEQLVVEKVEKDSATFTQIKKLKEEEREVEVARLLSGQVNEISLAHARSLLKR